jgi:hypothetical protein
MSKGKTREAAGIFPSRESLDAAITELEKHFPKSAFSVIGTHEALKNSADEEAPNPEKAIDSKDIPRHVPVKPEEKTVVGSAIVGGGAYVGAAAAGLALAMGGVSLPLTIAGAAIVGLAGGSVAGVLMKLTGDHYNEDMEKQLEAGGLLLWVNTQGQEDENIACSTMKKHGAKYVEVHGLNYEDQIN